jgi:hypothetical protein
MTNTQSYHRGRLLPSPIFLLHKPRVSPLATGKKSAFATGFV